MEKILVVDDEVHVLDSLEEFLKTLGYEVHTVTDGPAALNYVREMKPDIVLLDIIMPGMDGFDLLKEIKKIDPLISVIMVTAVADEELAKRALDLGAYDYITKPIDLHHLEEVVMVAILANGC